jgi:hypothetical protein
MRRASLKRVNKRKKEEAISYISSYQTLTADKKIEKLLSSHEAQKKSGSIYGTIAVNLLNSCGWGYGGTFIPLPPQTYPQIWESLLKS